MSFRMRHLLVIGLLASAWCLAELFDGPTRRPDHASAPPAPLVLRKSARTGNWSWSPANATPNVPGQLASYTAEETRLLDQLPHPPLALAEQVEPIEPIPDEPDLPRMAKRYQPLVAPPSQRLDARRPNADHASDSTGLSVTRDRVARAASYQVYYPPAPSPQEQHLATDRTPPRHHLIIEGDTLPAIATRYLGSPDRYLELFQANRDVLEHPEILPLGVELRIPD